MLSVLAVLGAVGGIHWLNAAAVIEEVSDAAGMYPDAPPAVMAASGEGSFVSMETMGIDALGPCWADWAPGPGNGSAGDLLDITVDGVAFGEIALEEDATVALEDDSRAGDPQRSWAGLAAVSMGIALESRVKRCV